MVFVEGGVELDIELMIEMCGVDVGELVEVSYFFGD